MDVMKDLLQSYLEKLVPARNLSKGLARTPDGNEARGVESRGSEGVCAQCNRARVIGQEKSFLFQRHPSSLDFHYVNGRHQSEHRPIGVSISWWVGHRVLLRRCHSTLLLWTAPLV